MPDRLIPPGYRAQLLGQSATPEGLNILAPLEEATAEGSLMLMRLDFAGFPATQALDDLQ